MPATPKATRQMRTCLLPEPFRGNLGQPIAPDYPDFVARLSCSERRECIRADFRTAECFTALSEMNRQLRVSRAVSPQGLTTLADVHRAPCNLRA